MKKLAALAVCILVLVALTTGFVCCGDGEAINAYVPDGAPALAVASLFKTKQIAGKPLNLYITTGADVQAKILNGEADFVICPTNMAAALYNKGADYKLLSANVFGLLYLVGSKPAQSLQDLKGQVVHSIGKNSTPEFVFKKILSYNGIEYADSDTAVEGKVAIRYYEKGSQIIPLLKSNVAHYAILGEPAATKSGANELFDLQELWKQATSLNESYPQAGVFVKSELLQDEKFTEKLLQALNGNAEYLADNSGKVASLLTQNGSSDFSEVTFTTQIIQRCNIRCVAARDCKAQMKAYFEAIKTVNGGFNLPDDDFYAK